MSDVILAALWRASWQGALVIAAIWCLCRSLEKRLPADFRCWLWRLGHIKLLLSLAVVSTVTVVLPTLPAPQALSLPQTTFSRTVAINTAEAAAAAATHLQASVKKPLTNSHTRTGHLQTALVTLYLLGVSVCLCRIGLAGFRTRRLLQEAAFSGNYEAEEDLARLALLLGLRRVPRLMVSSKTEIPVYTAGLVLLPATADYEARERRLILAHELAHARRRDLAWEWLGTLTQTLFFFHPLVLIARREERLARESAADALALHITEAPASTYGKLLLTISLCQPGKTLAGAIGVIENGSLLRRRLLNLKENPLMSTSRKSLIQAAVVASVVSAVMFVPWQLRGRSLQVQAATGQPATTAERAKAALESGDTKSATKYALQMLAKNTNTKDWNYGNIIHGANQILGLAALRERRTTDAKSYLIAAGRSTGSPQLNTFGPDMVLAQELLDRGEKDVVIQYLNLTARFWAHTSDADLARLEKRHPGYTARAVRMNLDTQKKIDGWKQQILADQKPQLNMSGVLRKIGPSK
jgi:beta-lactamase regulating signal transducer with metallopeptidase domain